MKTISAQEYKDLYGDQSYSTLFNNSPQGQQKAKTNSFLDRVKQTVQGQANKVNDAISGQGDYAGQGPIRRATGAVTAAFNTLPKLAIEDPVNAIGNAIGGTKTAQNFVTNHPGAAQTVENIARPLADPVTVAGNQIGKSKTLQNFVTNHPNATSKIEGAAGTVSNVGQIAGDILLADQAQSSAGDASSYVKGKLTPSPKAPVEPPSGPGLVQNVANDLTPSMDRIVNHQVTKALNLTPSDVKNISLSTGNEVGRFMADENLIRGNTPETVKALQDFFDQNYKAVRSEIGAVDTMYKPSQVPRYTEALKALKDKVEGVAGMQADSVEIEKLLNKKDGITLNDVQRVKELIDDHIDLYKATGDVREGIAKQGLDNVRRGIKTFVEQQVEANTGAKIGDMNNKVATSKGILKAVEARSTSGLTKSNISGTDFGAFISGTVASGGNPFIGAAAVFVKKLLESPSIQLKIAKFFDGLSDARKAAVKEDLQTGKIPQEFNQFIKTKNGSKGFEGPGAKNKDFSPETKVVNDLSKATPELHDAVNTEGASIDRWAEADTILKKAVQGKASAKELARAQEIVKSLKTDRAGFETKPL